MTYDELNHTRFRQILAYDESHDELTVFILKQMTLFVKRVFLKISYTPAESNDSLMHITFISFRQTIE